MFEELLFMVLSIEASYRDKNIQKPYPIKDQNGQIDTGPIYDRNDWKPYIRESPTRKIWALFHAS